MNKKFWGSVVTAGLLLTASVSITGCKDYETSYQKEQRLIPTIELAQLSHTNGIKTMENIGFMVRDKNKFSEDLSFTLCWYFGPKLDISREDYLVKMYSSDDLLFTGYGLGDKISLMYNSFGEEKIHDLGFNNAKELHSFIYNKLTSYSARDVYFMLENMEDHGLLKVTDIVNYDNLMTERDSLLGFDFYNYNQFDKSMLDTPSQEKYVNATRINDWTITVNGRRVHLTKEDFDIHAMTAMICKSILKNAEKGDITNVY